MKRAGNQWFHVSCAVWDCRRVEFEDLKGLEGLKIQWEMRASACGVCGVAGGLLSACTHCGQLCHLRCAWKAGYLFTTSEAPTTNVRRVLVSFACGTHTSSARDAAVQAQLRKHPFKYYQKPGSPRKRPRSAM